MDISRVKTEQLSTGELISVSFAVWLRSLWPTLKLSFIFFVVGIASVIAGLVAFGALSAQACVFLFTVLSAGLSLFFGFAVFTFSPVAEDIINGFSPSVVEGLAKVCSSIHKFIGASLLVGAFFLIFYIPMIFFKSPLVILPLMLLLFVLYVLTTPYIMFFPMAIYLRGAGAIESIKYSYYMVKGRWLKVLGWILLCMVINVVVSVVFMLLFKMATHGIVQSIGPKIASVMFGLGGGIFSLVLLLGSIIFAGIFIFLLIYSFWMSALTAMFLNLEFEPEEKTLHGDYDDEEENLVASSQPNEITEMFKNIKEVDVNVTSHTERRTALGPQNREEALRAFKKDDQITLPPVVPTITVPPSAPIPSVAPAAVQEPMPEHAEQGGMPTITIREKKDNIYHGLPSIYKPENDK